MIDEQPLDPELPIIDPHFHHWDIRPASGALGPSSTFLLPQASETVRQSGHAITHGVFVECHAMYRDTGPAALRSLGETEFATDLACASASGRYGATRFAHRIVGNVDLCLGEGAEPVLEAHVAVAGDRFAGIRHHVPFSEAGLFGQPCDPATRDIMRWPRFRAGARSLARMGLSLDLWCMHTQLADLTELADAVPELSIVLDHLGTPERLGLWEGRGDDARREWAAAIVKLAQRPNVRVKLGGMGMDFARGLATEPGSTSSQDLALAWRPYIETCIEAFGPQRCMFESNFPPDQATAAYGATWNAFKRVATNYSQADKDWLFRRTAAETYKF